MSSKGSKDVCGVSFRLGEKEYILRVTWAVLAAFHEIVGPDVPIEEILKTSDPHKVAQLFCAAATPTVTEEEIFEESPPFLEVVSALDQAITKGYIGPTLLKKIEETEKNKASRSKKAQ